MIATPEDAVLRDETDSSSIPSGSEVAVLLGAAALLSACGGGADASADSGGLPPAMLALQDARNNPALLQPTTPLASARAAPLASTRAAAVPDANALMDWAERNFPAFFPAHQATLTSAPYVYRYYPGSQNYLGVAGSDVYVLGSATGGQLVRVGALADFAGMVGTSYGTASPASDAEAARFLLQAQFSASDADIAALRQMGYGPWLAAQFSAAASTTGFDWLNIRGYGTIDNLTRYYDASYPGDYMIWHQLITSPDAMRKRVALALSEFFVVSLSGLNFPWRSHAAAAWWDMLVSNAFGNFRKLLEDVSLSPAMGNFLSSQGNLKENPTTGRVPDENFGREVMQLFSVGLYQLNLDGSEKRDANGNKIETYSQSDITNIARIFTGWDFDQTQNVPTVEPVQNRTIPSTTYTRLSMRLTPGNHSTLAASFLGIAVPAGTDGVTALKMTLDALFNHPNVGPFFGKQMIQRLVTSNPSANYVARVAAAFNDNGAGVRGDLQAVFSAILLDDEARNAAGLTQNGIGKLREPMLRLVQWARTFSARSAQGSWKIGDLSNIANQLGQSPLRSPTVFNFFRPGYVPPASALSASMAPAPEFQLVNESSVGGYLNYLQTVVNSGIYVNAPDLPNSTSTSSNGYDITAPYTAELALVTDANALVQRINLLMCAGQLSDASVTLMVNALNATAITATSTAAVQRNRVAAAVLLVMASSEYLIQK